MKGWHKTNIGDFSPFLYGKSLPKQNRSPGVYPVVSSAGVIGEHSEPLIRGPGIVIGRKGTVGSVTYVSNDFWPIDTAFYIIDTPETRDLKYTYYMLSHLGLSRMNSDSAVPGLNRDAAHGVEVIIPPLPEQRAIASILGALDDKIENNRKTAATLEEMARALYKSWFVDFDPVHAKAAGRAPAHMHAETAALFPDSFGDDGLPVGWEMSSLSEIATFLNGAALQKYKPREGDGVLHVIKIAQLRNGLKESGPFASNSLPDKYKIDDGDVIFSWSGSLLQKVWSGGPGALNQHLFKVSSERVPKWFHYLAVDQHMAEFRAIAASKATTMGHIQRHHLDQARIALPEPELLEIVDEIVAPIFDLMLQNLIEIRTLSNLRDTLLPKLMSGELRVGEAYEQIEDII